MELLLIGPPGSGKSAVGRAVARRHGAEFVDLDDAVEAAAGRPIPAIFDAEGEIGFRIRERAAIAALGPADVGPALRRVVAAGGGAIVEPRNRWDLFRGRRVVSLTAPPDMLLKRMRHGRVRPLLAGRDPLQRLRDLIARREPYYAAGIVVNAAARLPDVLAQVETVLASRPSEGTQLLRADTAIGRIAIGDGDAAPALLAVLGALEARRVAVVSEPVAWRLHGERLAAAVTSAGLDVVPVLVPRGEAAKTVSAYGALVRELARHRFERRDPLVAIGGGALGDAAGFAAATYLRGIPLVHVPTTLVAQVDSAIGGKTAIDIPEGKNLVGAFYQPRAVVIDVRHLATLPVRQRRAALGEAVKCAALGDERLFGLLEQEAPAIALGRARAYESGTVAEVVERCAMAKVAVVLDDEREQGRRMSLNLGHSIGHGIEAAAGYRRILHGEAVAYGLLGAIAIAREVGVLPPDRAERICRLVDAAGLARRPAGVREADVRAHMERDKKHASGRLQWVLPVESGVVIRTDVPERAVSVGIAAAIAGRSRVAAAAGAGA